MTIFEKLRIAQTWTERAPEPPGGTFGRLQQLQGRLREAFEALTEAPAIIAAEVERLELMAAEVEGNVATRALSDRLREGIGEAHAAWMHLAASLEDFEPAHCDEARQLGDSALRRIDAVEAEIADLTETLPLTA